MDSDSEFVMIPSGQGSEASSISRISSPDLRSLPDEERYAITPEPTMDPLVNVLTQLTVSVDTAEEEKPRFYDPANDSNPGSPMLTPVPVFPYPLRPFAEMVALSAAQSSPSPKPAPMPISPIPPLATALFPPLTTKLEPPKPSTVPIEELENGLSCLMIDNKTKESIIEKLSSDNAFFVFQTVQHDAEVIALKRENAALKRLKTPIATDIAKIRDEQLYVLEHLRNQARYGERINHLEDQLAHAQHTIGNMVTEIRRCHEEIGNQKEETMSEMEKAYLDTQYTPIYNGVYGFTTPGGTMQLLPTEDRKTRERTVQERQVVELRRQLAVANAELSMARDKIRVLEKAARKVEEPVRGLMSPLEVFIPENNAVFYSAETFIPCDGHEEEGW